MPPKTYRRSGKQPTNGYFAHEFCGTPAFSWCALAAVSLADCGASGTTASTPSDGHDHNHDHDHKSHDDGHDDAHAESLADAVAEVEQLDGAIQQAFAAGDFDKADGPVHQIGHALEEVSKLAAKESLSEADQRAVKKAVDDLYQCFGALDERVHGGESAGKSYDEVAEQIKSAIAQLRAVSKHEKTP